MTIGQRTHPAEQFLKSKFRQDIPRGEIVTEQTLADKVPKSDTHGKLRKAKLTDYDLTIWETPNIIAPNIHEAVAYECGQCGIVTGAPNIEHLDAISLTRHESVAIFCTNCPQKIGEKTLAFA
jgi:hypothetical protein